MAGHVSGPWRTRHDGVAHLQQPHEGRDVAGPLPELRRQQRREQLHVHRRQRAAPQLYELRKDLEDVWVKLRDILLRHIYKPWSAMLSKANAAAFGDLMADSSA